MGSPSCFPRARSQTEDTAGARFFLSSRNHSEHFSKTDVRLLSAADLLAVFFKSFWLFVAHLPNYCFVVRAKEDAIL